MCLCEEPFLEVNVSAAAFTGVLGNMDFVRKLAGL